MQDLWVIKFPHLHYFNSRQGSIIIPIRAALEQKHAHYGLKWNSSKASFESVKVKCVLRETKPRAKGFENL